jgi:NAD(P)-dependent dehydrogenase (short-subunit alcohol dehydrogenase family)
MANFEHRVAVVTGATKGIGLATARAFAEAGARVAIVDIDSQAGDGAVKQVAAAGQEARFYYCDLTDDKVVAETVEQIEADLGPISVLVNNAGVLKVGDVTQITAEDWRRVMETNVTSAFNTVHACVPRMKKRGAGTIINVASEAGISAIKGQIVYNVSKASLIHFTKCLAVDLAEYGIRANTVCPGTTYTPLVEKAMQDSGDPEGTKRALEGMRPMNRLGDVKEIAFAILSLASDEMAYATGAVLSVDGGATAQ